MSTNAGPAIEDMEALLRDADMIKVIRRGDLVAGVVMRIDPEGILVSIGHKSEGIIPPRESRSMTVEELASMTVGDEIWTRVMSSESEENAIILSFDRAKEEKGWKLAEEKLDSGEWVEGQITGHNRGGMLVDAIGLKGFIPISHVGGIQRGADGERAADLENRIGESVHLKVIEVDRARKRAIFSERMVLHEKRQTEKERILQELQEGEIRKGKVSGISDFGAFVDLGGADGLVHISELSWEPVASPDQVVSVGEEVEVFVMRVDREAKRIALSLRRTGPEPWDTISEKYQVDQLVTGTITKLTSFGAFARLEGSIEGLIHISELSHKLIQHPKEEVKEGDVLTLKILKIEPERKRLALSLKQAEEF